MSADVLAAQVRREERFAAADAAASTTGASHEASKASIVVDAGVAKKVAQARRSIDTQRNVRERIAQHREERLPAAYHKEVKQGMKAAAKLMGRNAAAAGKKSKKRRSAKK